MSERKAEPSRPDLAAGAALSTLEDGKILLGHADGEAAILVLEGDELFAVSATLREHVRRQQSDSPFPQ